MNEIIRDIDNALSSKRIVTLAAMAMLAIAVFVYLIFGKALTKPLIDGLVYIVLSGLGLSATERFGTQRTIQRSALPAEEGDIIDGSGAPK